VPAPRPGFDDALYDVVALTEAAIAEDAEGVGAILRKLGEFGAGYDVALVMAIKLLSEAVDEQDPPPGRFRQWALAAAARLWLTQRKSWASWAPSSNCAWR
jgi:hypothetical protein